MFDYHIPDPIKMSPYQRLLCNLLKQLSQMNWCRYQQLVYREIRVLELQDNDNNLHFCTEHEPAFPVTTTNCRHNFPTHAWHPVLDGQNTMINVIHYLCRMEANFSLWKDLTSTSITRVADHLTNCWSREFRVLKLNRCIRSFYNGIYAVVMVDGEPRPTFYNFFDYGKIPTNMVACKFFPQQFDMEVLQYYNWYHIPTPAFEQILDTQEFTPLTKTYIYAMLGRLFFDMNEHDTWEIIPFFKGVAGSGKSTIGKLMQKFFQKNDVGILSSNMEPLFGLQTLYDKLIWMCLEVTNSWKLSRADFQSMVTGEKVSVAVKNHGAKVVDWTVPGLMLGNDDPPWEDSSDSLMRRLLVIEFSKRVTNVDTTLDKKLDAELPLLLHKFTEAYLSTVRRVGTRSIWNVLPKYFVDIRNRMGQTLNPIKRFIHYCEDLVYAPLNKELKIKYLHFRGKFHQWYNQQNLGWKNVKFTDSQFLDIIQQESLDTKDEADGKYVCGITLRTDEIDDYEILKDLGNSEQLELKMVPEQYPCKFTQRLIETFLSRLEFDPYEDPTIIVCNGKPHDNPSIRSTSTSSLPSESNSSRAVRLVSVRVGEFEFRDSDILKHH